MLALIETVAPNLSDEEFFRASLRGLTADEKEDRAEWRRKRRFELDREERRRATRGEYDSRVGVDRPVVMMTRPPGLRKGYQEDLWAYIFRTVSGEYTWAVEHAADKVVIDAGTAATLDGAQREADAAAGMAAMTEWHPYPLVRPPSNEAGRQIVDGAPSS